MAQANYGIVDWYLAKEGFRFEDFKGKTREEVLDASSDDFFDKIMNYAKDKAQSVGKANTMDYLKNNTKFKEKSTEIIKNDNRMILGSNEWFDNQLKDRVKDINEDRVRVNKKREFENNISKYNSEEDLDKDIKNEEEFLDKLKSEIASSDIKVPEIKEDLLSKANEYDSESEVMDDIKVSKDYIEGLKERFKGAETEEERREVTSELKNEAPNTLRSLKGWQSRGVPEALKYITQ